MAASPKLRRTRSRTAGGLVMLIWLGVMVALAGLLASSQTNARRAVAQRLAARASGGAEFASLYAKDILARERQQAATWLAARQATPLSLEHASGGVGFSAAVLLDHDGRVLQAVPAKPGLVGKVITGTYPQLAAAVAGRASVSNVVPSVARGVPVVAFAVPFASASGTRVFSGAFDVQKTPLGGYMSHVIVVPGRRVYLVDASGSLIASSGVSLARGDTLGQLDRPLAELTRLHSTGSYPSGHGQQFFVSAPISGTPWRIVVAVPESQLYNSVDGASKWLAWVAVTSLAIAGLIIIMMGIRMVRSRERLTVLNADLAGLNSRLDHLARVDSLTGLRNRRDIEESLMAALSSARRHDTSLSVLLIDIDHFKRVNDTQGHQAGDAVLLATAQTIQTTLRTEDTVGRWGGEEFLAVLPHTDAQGAVVIAERLRAHVAKPGPGKADPGAAMTVTIGVATWTSGGMDELISRADAALYAGKNLGRNNVQIFSTEPHHDVVYH